MWKTDAKRTLSVLLGTILAISQPLNLLAASDSENLQSRVDAAASVYRAESQMLVAAENDTANAEREISALTEQSEIILSAIQDINAQMDELSTSIWDMQQRIAEKEIEIEQKQTAYDLDKQNFKSTMGAMQEMHDGGEIALLNAANSLYQLLTFPEVLQDISRQYTDSLDRLETEREALENSRQELMDSQQTLQDAQDQLQSQQAALEEKQAELADSIQLANETLSDAQAAKKAQQAIADDAEKRLEAAIAEQDAYIKGQLGASTTPALTCGLSFSAPLVGYQYISTNFGDLDSTHTKPHAGTDFAAPAGTPIMATEDGCVLVARSSSSYGNYVVIYHGVASDGHKYSTLYAHMTSYCVSAGQSVSRGDVIGYVGTTGHSTGNHLHLELWQGNTKIDPLLYIPKA